ncbi:MAG: tetratricopeptide repeat protein [Verrucomicrobia bacterium]|nr:MAG: tetratricopeptide repeat protein [Verrucomicrobiota bacterium]
MNRKQRRANQKASQVPAVTAAGDDPVTLHAMGVEAFRAGQLQAAARLIGRAIAAHAQMPDFHYNLAIVLRAQGKLTEAAASYHRAIALKPDYGDAHNNLGNVWKALGERDKARACFERALVCNPDNADTYYNLGILSGDDGDTGAAARYFQKCMECDPQDGRGVHVLLAYLGKAGAPLHTSHAHILKLYDVRSRFWDNEDAYFGARLVANALREHAVPEKLNVLDIGCGTGLAGALVRPLARRLDGVDLSPAMLEKARAKSVYDRLDQADALLVMSQRANSYDAILGAAVLIHFGDLTPIFRAARNCLRPNGLFVFTLFSLAGEENFAVSANYRLAQSGCFAHSNRYVRQLAKDCGLAVDALRNVVHEHDPEGNPIPGLLAVLRAP